MATTGRPLTVGERIEIRRRRLGLSRRVVAQLAGRSEEWLRQIERGHRELDSIAALYRMAEVLHLDDPAALLGHPTSSRSAARDIAPALTPLNHAIMDHPTARAFGVEPGPPPPPERVRAALEQCWNSWLGAPDRYTRLTTHLPVVLRSARSLRAATRTTASGSAHDAGLLLAESYHLARFLLTRVGDYHLAWLVADRPVGIFADAKQPILVAVSAWHVAAALNNLGYHAECRDYALAAARRLEPVRAGRSVLGALQLVAAYGAAGVGDSIGSQDLVTAARETAAGVDPEAAERRDVWFGVAEVAIAEIDIAVRLGRLSEAARHAAQVELADSASVEQRVRYYTTIAHVYGLLGDDTAAVVALQRACQACPEDIRYDWLVHRTLQRLSRRDHHLVRRELTALLTVAGLA
ncbi:helix-turn-helix domain-containing protein [Nocardia sp. NPDC051832]|uniref:helix-turn-helix domain-containing protein n=1 Tax=Nocardia sp. NPDC051832 TaxID=3155673 RepID=UPI003446BDAC